MSDCTSVLVQLWKVAGIPYIQISHGSDTNYIFDGVFPEGDLGGPDSELSKMFTRSLISLAFTCNLLFLLFRNSSAYSKSTVEL